MSGVVADTSSPGNHATNTTFLSFTQSTLKRILVISYRLVIYTSIFNAYDARGTPFRYTESLLQLMGTVCRLEEIIS